MDAANSNGMHPSDSTVAEAAEKNGNGTNNPDQQHKLPPGPSSPFPVVPAAAKVPPGTAKPANRIRKPTSKGASSAPAKSKPSANTDGAGPSGAGGLAGTLGTAFGAAGDCPFQRGWDDFLTGKRPGGNCKNQACFCCKKTRHSVKNTMYICDADCGWGAHHMCLGMAPGAEAPDTWFCSKGCHLHGPAPLAESESESDVSAPGSTAEPPAAAKPCSAGAAKASAAMAPAAPAPAADSAAGVPAPATSVTGDAGPAAPAAQMGIAHRMAMAEGLANIAAALPRQPGWIDWVYGKRPGGNKKNAPCYVCKKTKSSKEDPIYLCDGDCGWGAHKSCLGLAREADAPDKVFCCCGCCNACTAKKAAKAAKAAAPKLNSPGAGPSNRPTDASKASSPSKGKRPVEQEGAGANKRAKTGQATEQAAPTGGAPAARPAAVPVAAPAPAAATSAAAAPAAAAAAAAADQGAEQSNELPPRPEMPAIELKENGEVTDSCRYRIMHSIGHLLRYLGKPHAMGSLVRLFTEQHGTPLGRRLVTYDFTFLTVMVEFNDIPGMLDVLRTQYQLDV